jgi:hypothetical protein
VLKRTLHRNLTDEYFEDKAGGEPFERRFISGNGSTFVRGSAVEIRIDCAASDSPMSRARWCRGAGEVETNTRRVLRNAVSLGTLPPFGRSLLE